MKTKKITLFQNNNIAAKLVAVLVVVLFTAHSYAATITWTGPTSGGDWATASNWSGGSVPVSTDSVLIASGNVVTLSTDAGKINSLTVQGKLNVAPTGILVIEQYVKSKALLLVEGGEVDNTGNITVTQKLANSISGIALADGLASSKFKNSGTLTVNMNVSGTDAKSDCITFKQTTGGTATFVSGGSMTFTPNPNNKIIFQNLTGNGQIDGTAVIGASDAYKNARLIQVAGGNLTILSTASVEIYSGLTSGAIILLNNVGTAATPSSATLTNNGILKVHANASVASNALQFSPGIYATSTLTNSGSIIFDGTYSTSNGVILCSGSDATSFSVINNLSGGSISATNTYGTSITTGGTSNSPGIVTSNTKNTTVNNSGTITLNATGKCIVFGGNLCTFNNNNGGYVSINTGITGGTSTTCNFYNNAGATFDFNLPVNPNVGSIANAYTALSNSGKILFTNSGGTVTGRGLFQTDLFVPSNGKIAPGNASGATPYGQIQVNGAAQDYSQSTLSLKIGGKSAGTNCDQLLIGTAGAAVNITNTNLNLTFDAAYTPADKDSIALIKTSTATAPIITGNFASTILPIGWALNYTTDITRLIYNTPTATISPASASASDTKVYVEGNKLKISLENEMSAVLKLMDLTGRTIIESSVKGQNNSIETNRLKGIYIVRLHTGSGDFSQKISL